MAESPVQPAQSFQEVLSNQSASDENNVVNPSTVSPESQSAESPLQPAPSPGAVSQNQSASEEKNDGKNKEKEDAESGRVAATYLSNLLPTLSNLCIENNLIKVDPSKVQSPDQPLTQPTSVIQNQQALSILSLAGRAENPGQNIVPFTGAQTKPDSSASAISVRQDIANILNLKENELQAGLLPKIVQLNSGESNSQGLNPGTSADPKNVREEGEASLLDGGAVQAKATFAKTELIPSLFLKQKETTMASFADVINDLPEGQGKSLSLTGTTFQSTPWAMTNEASQSDPLKSEFNANLLGKKITLPGVSTDSPTLLGFDEKLDILLGQNSTGAEVAGRSLNDEFTGFGNPAAEKDDAKANSGGENQPTQDPFNLNGLLAGPKPTTVVEETGTPQKPQPSQTGQVDPYQQVADKVVWSIRNNEERIQLTLEPPQLGNLFIELQREKEGIKATLWADNPKTKEILENNQSQLQKTLEGHGFKLEKYDVFLQNDMASSQGKEEKPVFHGQGSREKSLQIHEAESDPALEILPAAIPVAGGSQYIDRFI